MSRGLRYALASGTLFLALLSLATQKPGLPITLKADEPAYLGMSLSLARDGDVRCDERDYGRLLDAFPYIPVENLILMSADGGDTVVFAKPYLYSLLAAPLVALFGANGMVVFNALLFALMVALGTLYLRRFNEDGAAALFATAFFALSPAFTYVFWLQPELLNMASAALCLFFALHRFEPRPAVTRLQRWMLACLDQRTAPAWSGALLAVGTYNKPVLALLGLPALLAVARRLGRRAAAVWLLSAALAMSAIVAGSMALSGSATPYLGTTRAGVRVESVEQADSSVRQALARVDELSTTGNTWSWIFRLPEPAPGELAENLRYFFVGRHVGLLPYFPFTALCLLLFLLHRHRSLERWATIAALAATALFYILTIPLNWHGGGGFVGNRYFATVYPAFLFLVTSVRPLWLVLPSVAVSTLLLGQLLVTPFGAPVLKPTLQAHLRNPLFRFLPFELSLRNTIPGYEYVGFPKATFLGRRDVVRTLDPERQIMWFHGALRADMLLLTADPIEGVFFAVTSEVPDNQIRIGLAGDARTLVFENAHNKRQRTRLVELKPRRIDQRHVDHLTGKRLVAYDFWIQPATGRRWVNKNDPSDVFYPGARVTFLGRRDQVGRVEHYRLDWLRVEAPSTVPPAARFTVRAVVRNAGESPLSSEAALPVFVSYHWFDERGGAVEFGGRRTVLPAAIETGAESELEIGVEAPAAAGRYRLALDAVREPVAWFSQKGNETWEQVIDVTTAAVSSDSREP